MSHATAQRLAQTPLTVLLIAQPTALELAAATNRPIAPAPGMAPSAILQTQQTVPGQTVLSQLTVLDRGMEPFATQQIPPTALEPTVLSQPTAPGLGTELTAIRRLTALRTRTQQTAARQPNGTSLTTLALYPPSHPSIIRAGLTSLAALALTVSCSSEWRTIATVRLTQHNPES